MVKHIMAEFNIHDFIFTVQSCIQCTCTMKIIHKIFFMYCCKCTHVHVYYDIVCTVHITCSFVYMYIHVHVYVHVDSFLQVATDLLVRQKTFSVGQPGKEIQITQ